MFFFFKQQTAYELRISDWSSDVCSSDLRLDFLDGEARDRAGELGREDGAFVLVGILGKGNAVGETERRLDGISQPGLDAVADRKSVVKGKSVSVRVDLGGRRIIKKKNQ